MADYGINYYDNNEGSHKRRCIWPAGLQSWATSEPSSPYLSSHMLHDPLRYNVEDGMLFVNANSFDVAGRSLNDGSLSYPESDLEIFSQFSTFQEQDFLHNGQAFVEQTTTTSVRDPYDEWDARVADSDQSTFEASRTTLTHTLDGVSSSPLAQNLICFGMISDAPCQRNQSGSTMVESASLPLRFYRPNSLLYSDTDRGRIFGKLEDRIAKILVNLLSENGVMIQLYSRNTSGRSTSKAKRNKKSGSNVIQSLVNAIIYGPEDLCESVGEYLTKCGICLQDPIHNDIDVFYRNPHILSRTEDAVLISELTVEVSENQVNGIGSPQDLFSQLSKDDHLSLTEAPYAVHTELYPHQKKALTFMLQREQAWTFEGSESDLWVKEADETGEIIYSSLITGNSQNTEPLESRGGLLADKMGLGKSLTMISLIALNPTQCREPVIFTSQGTIRRVKSTLIVVPYSLLKTWDTQMTKHLKLGSLTWTRFHGPQKSKILSFNTYDIVISTYKTLASQLKKHKDPKCGDTLFSFAWHRIVLDEAHTIRNRATSLAQACCAVRATSRWAMTGTPIQNRVTDFASLLEYLQICPFSNPKTFEAEIVKPCLNLEDPDVSMMRKLVNCISLCRTKAVISLPKREDETRYLDFSPKEREYYDRMKLDTINEMDEALAHNPVSPGNYLNALQWLNELRLICNHGLVHSRKAQGKASIAIVHDQVWNQKVASKAFETMVEAGEAACQVCRENITKGTGEWGNSESPRPSLSKCLTLICGSCVQIKVEGKKVATCSCTPKCPKVDVSWAPELVETRIERPLLTMKPEEPSTKLKALLEGLQECSKGEKSVVFSYWTFTLDLVEILLKDAFISFTRIDGKHSGSQRDEAIHRFEIDETVQVILVSITCGGTGLDLTAASTAYLLEPQWNPMIEEQALCRIHRLGQTKKVRTIRFRIKNSFEDRIEMIQQDKKDLAAWAFSDDERAEAADGTSRLQALRKALR